jgi:hypothetical protein
MAQQDTKKKSRFSTWLSYLMGPAPEVKETTNNEDVQIENHNLEQTRQEIKDAFAELGIEDPKTLDYDKYSEYLAKKRQTELDQVKAQMAANNQTQFADDDEEDDEELASVADTFHLMNAGLVKDNVDKSKMSEEQRAQLQAKLDADKQKMEAHRSEREKQIALLKQQMSDYDKTRSEKDNEYKGYSWDNDNDSDNDVDVLMYSDFLTMLGENDTNERAAVLRSSRNKRFDKLFANKKSTG